jgi:hypothetical protein
MLRYLTVGSDPLFKRSGLYIGNVLAAGAGLHVLGKIALMRGHEIVVQGDGVWDEFDDSSIQSQWKNLVGPNSQVPLACRLMIFQKTADLLEYLFHDCVLT